MEDCAEENITVVGVGVVADYGTLNKQILYPLGFVCEHSPYFLNYVNIIVIEK